MFLVLFYYSTTFSIDLKFFQIKSWGGSNYNFTAILLQKKLSPMAVLEIVTNCSLRKRNPISCGGSVAVTGVELAQRQHSAAGEQESAGGLEWVQVPNKGSGNDTPSQHQDNTGT